MEISEQLQFETKKWLAKIKAERPKVELVDKSKADFLKNIDAYVADAEHFMSKKDFVRSFEAVIWAWANLEVGERLGVLEREMRIEGEKP